MIALTVNELINEAKAALKLAADARLQRDFQRSYRAQQYALRRANTLVNMDLEIGYNLASLANLEEVARMATETPIEYNFDIDINDICE